METQLPLLASPRRIDLEPRFTAPLTHPCAPVRAMAATFMLTRVSDNQRRLGAGGTFSSASLSSCRRTTTSTHSDKRKRFRLGDAFAEEFHVTQWSRPRLRACRVHEEPQPEPRLGSGGGVSTAERVPGTSSAHRSRPHSTFVSTTPLKDARSNVMKRHQTLRVDRLATLGRTAFLDAVHSEPSLTSAICRCSRGEPWPCRSRSSGLSPEPKPDSSMATAVGNADRNASRNAHSAGSSR